MSQLNNDIAIVYKPSSTGSSTNAGDNNTKPTPIHTHAAELTHFGISHIYASCTSDSPGTYSPKRPGMQVNVFAIASAEWEELQTRVGGSFGFRHWHGSPFPELNLEKNLTVRQLDRVALEDTPVLIRELIGRRYRVYKSNQGLDRSRDPERINIESDEDGRIVGIWIG